MLSKVHPRACDILDSVWPAAPISSPIVLMLDSDHLNTSSLTTYPASRSGGEETERTMITRLDMSCTQRFLSTSRWGESCTHLSLKRNSTCPLSSVSLSITQSPSPFTF